MDRERGKHPGENVTGSMCCVSAWKPVLLEEPQKKTFNQSVECESRSYQEVRREGSVYRTVGSGSHCCKHSVCISTLNPHWLPGNLEMSTTILRIRQTEATNLDEAGLEPRQPGSRVTLFTHIATPPLRAGCSLWTKIWGQTGLEAGRALREQ